MTPAPWLWAETGFLKAMGVVDLAGSCGVNLVGGAGAFVGKKGGVNNSYVECDLSGSHSLITLLMRKERPCHSNILESLLSISAQIIYDNCGGIKE